MASLLVDGQVCKAQLDNTEKAYRVCVDDHHPSIAWWQQPEIIIAGGLSISVLGFLVGFTKCFGSCR